MYRVLKIGSAFIGIIIGAGFASGQEILQYFTSFGYAGTLGAMLATALFAYLGMSLTKIGSRLQTTSHRDAIYTISGRYLGTIVDAVLLFTQFGVGVVMIAGAGSLLNQQFGFQPVIGNIIVAILIIITMMLNVNRVIAVIGSVTPFLILTIFIICIYSLFTMDMTFNELNPIAKGLEKSLPNWFIAAINYASFNIAVGAGMSIVIGGAEKNERIASIGGLVGGLGIGVLIVSAHLAIFSKIDVVHTYEMPLLKIGNDISPILGFLMSFILFGMIFNTGISMFYAFAARFFHVEGRSFKIGAFIIVIIGFAASFVGFTELVAKLYKLIGYLGLFLILALIYAPFKLRKLK
ncbi:hypothetical protein FHP05_14665 [Cerasibacillus terrae]|uniref:Transporter n=1 Tax=Cerasibacillus terrae TaxID=2498845 RepID=A0A5C8NGT9_9BACI|nr:hypothetical protein [Cerasibacillus terrae]TXL57850.1 hypothetical protein FHP05_14665 [Cerasibacillus terrae]